MFLDRAGERIATFDPLSRAETKVASLRLFTTRVTPVTERVPVRGTSLPFTAALAVADLRRLNVFPVINNTMRRGMFYSDPDEAYPLNLEGYNVFHRETVDNSSSLAMAVPGNSNLFTNMGYWAYAKNNSNVFGGRAGWFVHFQETLFGPQNALVLDEHGVNIRAVSAHEASPSYSAAMGGTRMISNGKVMGLEDIDQDTGRETFIDTIGDMQHIFLRPPDLISLRMRLMCLAGTQDRISDDKGLDKTNFYSFYRDFGRIKYRRQYAMPPQLREALRGMPVEMGNISESDWQEMSRGITKQLAKTGMATYDMTEGYGRTMEFARLSRDKNASEIRIRMPRSTYAHMLACTTADPSQLLIFSTFDTDKKEGKGLIYEDTAYLAKEIAKQAGYEVRDAIVLCNCSEPMIWTPGYQIASFDGMSRYVTSALLFYPKA